MLFNSFAFAVFLPVVYALYWAIRGRSLHVQNGLLLVASYVFYGWWDPRFLLLIVLSSAVDYSVGLGLARTHSRRGRRALLGVSLALNLGLLGVFKYYNFFVVSLTELLTSVGLNADVRTLQVILPVGISFYTFQTLSYTIDLYRRRIEPTRDALAFFAFVSFFPQLVAGPIERASQLLPQFRSPRVFDRERAHDGLRQILWGLFKKMVVADGLAPSVDAIFAGYAGYPSPVLVLGTLYFAIQIYCDFSGYSDIAIGTARLFGFDLMRNFAFPYFSRDIGEFWRRWHISLSGWFRDYVYIPLGGSRTSRARHLSNIFVTFVVSGLWHGANWTFVVWGALHGLYYLPLVMARRHKLSEGIVAAGRWFPSTRELLSLGVTFSLVLVAWVFFRADDLPHAIAYLDRMATGPWGGEIRFVRGLVWVAVLMVVEWPQRTREHALDLARFPGPLRWGAYYAVVAAILLFAPASDAPFIYFQF